MYIYFAYSCVCPQSLEFISPIWFHDNLCFFGSSVGQFPRTELMNSVLIKHLKPAYLPRLRRFSRLASPHSRGHLLSNVPAWPSGLKRLSLFKARQFGFARWLSFSSLSKTVADSASDRQTNTTCLLYIRMISPNPGHLTGKIPDHLFLKC